MLAAAHRASLVGRVRLANFSPTCHHLLTVLSPSSHNPVVAVQWPRVQRDLHKGGACISFTTTFQY